MEGRRGEGDYLGRRLSTSSDGEEEECGRTGETSSRFAEKSLVFIDSLFGVSADTKTLLQAFRHCCQWQQGEVTGQ